MSSLFILAITGASGAIYAKCTLRGILNLGHDVACVISPAGKRVLEIEEGLNLSGNTTSDQALILNWCDKPETRGTLELFHEEDVAAKIASGSCRSEGMIVVPCSGGTLARVAHGISGGLIERSAEVCLKERRKLILVLRETPISLVYIRNMQAAAEAGATILPAAPGFYHHPKTIEDLADTIAGRTMDALGLQTPLVQRWRGVNPENENE